MHFDPYTRSARLLASAALRATTDLPGRNTPSIPVVIPTLDLSCTEARVLAHYTGHAMGTVLGPYADPMSDHYQIPVLDVTNLWIDRYRRPRYMHTYASHLILAALHDANKYRPQQPHLPALRIRPAVKRHLARLNRMARFLNGGVPLASLQNQRSSL